MRIVLGVSGGIAAYKAAEVLRGLTEQGHEVTVVPTESALNFVGVATWSALSGSPAVTDVFADTHEVRHVRLGREADMVVVVPATADLLSRAATGRADDLLTSTLLTARGPVVYVPAMHTEMWEHPATAANVATLRDRGAIVVEPAEGRLTGADSGKGRLPEPSEILWLIDDVMTRDAQSAAQRDLTGLRIVVSAGGTREPIDPVRFIGNRSSGRQGYAVARAAASRGASVTLVSANVALPQPAGVDIVAIGTAEELRATMLEHAHTADVLVMVAAVADYRPVDVYESKIKKTGGGESPTSPLEGTLEGTLELTLERTPDILAELSATRPRKQLVVGFAAETGDAFGSVLEYGRSKLAAKGCDLLVVNEVGGGRGFESDQNEAVVLGADGTLTEVPHGPKSVLANILLDEVGVRCHHSDV